MVEEGARLEDVLGEAVMEASVDAVEGGRVAVASYWELDDAASSGVATKMAEEELGSGVAPVILLNRVHVPLLAK